VLFFAKEEQGIISQTLKRF